MIFYYNSMYVCTCPTGVMFRTSKTISACIVFTGANGPRDWLIATCSKHNKQNKIPRIIVLDKQVGETFPSWDTENTFVSLNAARLGTGLGAPGISLDFGYQNELKRKAKKTYRFVQ